MASPSVAEAGGAEVAATGSGDGEPRPGSSRVVGEAPLALEDDVGEWCRSIEACTASEPGTSELRRLTSGAHKWANSSHHRPTFCNICKEKFTGVPWHGYACEVCKLKAHKRCADRAVDIPCKWTVMDTIPAGLQYVTPENSVGPHQWLQGNLPMGSKCAVCERACGSVLKLQDYRCLWCAACVHDSCQGAMTRCCLLGPTSLSVLPPIAVERIEEDGRARIRDDATGGDYGGGSPLLVLVNSKSGDNQGHRLIRKLRRLLNPIQVFDLIACGPDFPLTFFAHFDTFRVLVAGGDGTVGWVLSALDRLGMHAKCQLGILPLGTGNDLARVLGWGHAFYNDARLPNMIRTYERAHTRMLDRWSIMAFEGVDASSVRRQEQNIASKVTAVMAAETPMEVISAVRHLCICVRELMERVQSTYDQVENWERQLGRHPEDPLTDKCRSLLARLNPLMAELSEMSAMEESGGVEAVDGLGEEERARRERLVQRANSLKKALVDMLEYAEQSIDRHNRETRGGGGAAQKRDRFKKKRSKTTPSGRAASPPASPSQQAIKTSLGSDPSASRQDRKTSRPLTLDNSLASGGQRRSRLDEEDEDDEDEEPEPGPSCVVHPPTPASPTVTAAKVDWDNPMGSLKQKADSSPSTGSAARIDGGGDIKQSHSDSSLYEMSQAASPSTSAGGERSTVVHRKGRSATIETALGTQSARQRAYLSTNDRSRQTLMDRLPALKRGILSSGLTGGSLIAEVLLLHANVHPLGSELDWEDPTLNPDYKELKVMSNYFGIGLDAKIALDFHNKREEVPDKQRSRSKLFMWYGILGGKELVHRTYRNLDQRIRLECDGLPIDLPSLQGIVILNIPSYSGGANFWGEGRESEFTVQSYDDKVLEVVALFGVIHVATSRVPNVVRLQNHRIAQCRHVKITINGDEPIPVQVDGEPWLQPPGVLQIVHKNRAQLLVKNAQSFDASLRTWEEHKSTTAPSTPTALNSSVPQDSDRVPFSRRASAFVSAIESEMAHLGLTAKFLDTLEDTSLIVRRAEQAAEDDATAGGHPEWDRLSLREEVVGAIELITEQLESHLGLPSGGNVHGKVSVVATRPRAASSVISPLGGGSVGEAGPSTSSLGGHARETTGTSSSSGGRGPSTSSSSNALTSGVGPSVSLSGGPVLPSQFQFEGETTNWRFVINNVRQEMLREETEIREGRAIQRGEKTQSGPTGRMKSFANWVKSKLRRKSHPFKNAPSWTIEEVGNFLGQIGLAEYATNFKTNEITGRELVHLERGDIHDLGVVKLGHAKRLQNAIADIREHATDMRTYVAGGGGGRGSGQGSTRGSGGAGGGTLSGAPGGSGNGGSHTGTRFNRAFLAPGGIEQEDESCEYSEMPSNSSM